MGEVGRAGKPRHFRFTLPDGQVWRTGRALGDDGTCTAYEREGDHAVASVVTRPELYASLCEAHRRRLVRGRGSGEGEE